MASAAAAWKSSSEIPGTTPVTVRWLVVIPSPGTKVTSALTSRDVGGVPALSRPFENAMQKHDECAAAMSSSGLVVPFGSSVRAGHETS